ncbi:methylase involved in ubiquinone/menaquinone biosynthesis [Candidatus Nitrososphaera evergladensis SR1]|jgi:arsenite methyltransferase|uniref:Arsenite methyltransferase n=1 Tax=Candidatus Nitrososphaera evergladensis SR1 TaxID=1459636 RepID=A0A075MLX8_9ARCH|nr:arsenite methyltransferase [Candidatus Nitrososphaera evergladensis]AIF82140.1 methylase involved in ubiquinone/menaquinone biosynthesis [Candidatus Nitrososphaera evergladensis SR1]
MNNNGNIKEKVREKYGRVALLQDSCCGPGECGCGTSLSPMEAAGATGYSKEDLSSVPEAAILGAGCGAPLNFADLKEGETVVDLGSGAGIDVFLSAKRVGAGGRAIGIDMTDEMLAKARKNASEHGGYENVEFRKGDIEERIPLEDASADAVISNCVINLTLDKVKTFSEIHRVLKDGGRMVISDIVTDSEAEAVDPEEWCSCIDGALTKENYVAAIKKAGFGNATVLEERPYIEKVDGRRLSSIVVRAMK